MPLSPGSIVAGKYQVLRELGVGGMGVVYEARHLVTEGKIALKVMNEGLRHDREAAHRFVQEARAVAKVQHPGIVPIYDAGTDDEIWLAMQLLEGENLRARLDRGPLELSEIDDVFGQLLDVLAHVHQAGIVHRDLKPENVFLERAGSRGMQVRLLDFGIAKLNDPAPHGPTVTRFGSLMGTLHYMAPEQAREAKDVDLRADVYALGAMLYECLTGTVPHQAATLGELVTKFYTEPLKEPPLASQVARAYAAIALECLAIEPAERPRDCEGIATRLKAVADPLPQPVGPGPSLRPGTDRSSARPSWLRPKVLWAALPLVAGGLLVWALPNTRAPASSSPRAGVTAPAPSLPPTRAPEAARPASVQPPASLAVQPALPAPSARSQSEGSATAEPALGAREGTTARRRGSAAASPELADSLTPEQLNRVVQRDRAALQRCFNAALRASGVKPAGESKVDVHVTANADGSVGSVLLDGNGVGDMNRCIERLVWRWHFPRAAGSTVFVLPLLVEPGS